MYDPQEEYFENPGEFSTEELEKAITSNTEVIVNADLVREYVKKSVEKSLAPVLKGLIDNEIKRALTDRYSSKAHIDTIIRDVIKEKMLEKFPNVVENKVNEFEKLIRESKLSDHRNDPVADIHSKAKAKVEKYIQDELVESVKKTKEEIDVFAKNYFTNNLFRAMGIMTQQFNSLPEAK